ncbi:universal stress protein [Saccharicrinis aurantiacus]|uniref:universal stress protein n=1 Tax=Saccharicrinis aurantiacus TaxID=1849719 RepID=UPI0008380ACE|nr:universal stress protein [Saccharicrinis aurantiacus]
MENSEKIIVVPFDFTPVAFNAIEHAKILSLKQNATIALLHIVKKDDDIDKVTVTLNDEILKLKSINPKTTFKGIVREGTIFKTINSVADEIGAIMLVMGTHGIKGMQKLTGSWALKVIVGSKIPFLVVQDPPAPNEVRKIVFPVNFKTQNKEKLIWVDFLSKFYHTKIYLFGISNKGGEVDSRTKANLAFCKNFLSERNINYELSISTGKESLAQETIAFAKQIEANVIMTMTTRDIAFHDYVLGTAEQQIIANEHKIPAMVVNPRTDLMKYGYGGF